MENVFRQSMPHAFYFAKPTDGGPRTLGAIAVVRYAATKEKTKPLTNTNQREFMLIVYSYLLLFLFFLISVY